MSDWTDETRERLEKEEKRLRLKAANLKERHGEWSLMAAQELVVADDIRAALEEIERRGRGLDMYEREVQSYKARAEYAEAEVAEWKAKAHIEAKGNRCAYEAEAERLRVALEAYDKLSLVIESAVRERRDRDGREEGNYELLLRVISQSRAALLGGGE